MSSCILLMTKAPRVGDVKSRLATEMGNERAAELYRCFLLDLLDTLKEVGTPFIIYYTPADALDELKIMLGEEHQFIPQEGGDLGERLYHGLEIAKKLGYRSTIALASDVPDITEEYLTGCVEALGMHEAVIGPSTDGGYNLIGLNLDHLDERFFTGINWGTDTVFSESMERLAGLDIHVPAPWSDIDNASDLEKLCMSEASHTMRYLRGMRED